MTICNTFFLLFLFAGCYLLATAHQQDDSDSSTLLRIAREFRTGNGPAPINLPRAVHFYEYAIERSVGKIQGEIFWELYGLLDESPGLSSKHSHWDLVVRAAEEGHSEAQHLASTSYATGIFKEGLVPQDSSRSLLLEYFSALSGNPRAHVGMGYRYLNGIGVKESCERALPFYEYAANHAIQFVEEHGYFPILDKTHLSDSAHSNSNWMRQEVTQELTDYYAHLAESGDVVAATMLGNIYNIGSRVISMDQEKAIYFLNKAAKQKYAAGSGLLGYILAKRYFRESKFHEIAMDDKTLDELSPTKILDLLRIGGEANDANALVGLGYVHLHGIGFVMNATKAVEYFQRALITHADAGFFIGEVLTKKVFQSTPSSISVQKLSSGVRSQDLAVAIQAYSSSAQLGNILSQHRLAHLTSKGLGVSRSCENAISGFKAVAERGSWAVGLNHAHKLYQQRDYVGALFAYSQLAAIGFETAQFNAAFILANKLCPQVVVCKQCHSILASKSLAITSQTIWEQLQLRLLNTASNVKSLKTFAQKRDKVKECDVRSLSLLGLSAAHGNSESFVLIGDFYYYGYAGLLSSRTLSTLFYQKAADLHNTQAIFNLGLMHEVGDSVAQDFHLAKRYYDLAAEVDPKAKVPRDIALFAMEIHRSLLTFGAHELLTEIPQLKQALIEVKEMILLLLEKLVDLDGFIRNYLDDFHITSDVAWQSFQKEISNTIPSTIVYQALHWYESWKLLMTNVLFQRDKTQLPFEESAISIDIAKFVGLLVFLIFLFWIKSRRQRALV